MTPTAYKGRPCPQCGGDDRFYRVPVPRNGSAPFWHCNQCNYTESEDPNAALPEREREQLTPEQQALVLRGYAAVADYCADLLWEPACRQELEYLRSRGITDATIHELRLGGHPDTISGGVGQALWEQDQDAYNGATIAGLLAKQGRIAHMLRGVVTFRYGSNGTCPLLRTRKLAGDGPKYLNPPGELYAGTTPELYLKNVLAETSKVILTEGEIKAILAYQAWREGTLSMPSIAQPGISILPDAFMDALAGKTVYLVYDSERRKDPFQLSPGERFTIRNGERLTGLGAQRRITALQRKLAKEKDPEAQERLQAEITKLEAEVEATHARNIRVHVVRLPRDADTEKVDLDSFLLAHGPAALQALLDKAPKFEDWHEQHGDPGYHYAKGGIWQGDKQLANYQARVIEDISQFDGIETTSIHRLALRAPSGTQYEVDIPASTWADARKAMEAIRAGMHAGTADDEGAQTFKAIKALSRHGDDPARRTVYTCTGWEKIDGRWHYLMPDGAITAAGVVSHIASELPAHAQGNHYAMCGTGDAQRGAAAFLKLLRGDVCSQGLALALAAHAALAVIHRFIGHGDRPAVWPHGESGVLKTALVRVLLSLSGPEFTAERADGLPLLKWDSTYNALELNAFTYRDVLFAIDDYKQATAGRDTTARFLHAYSEGSSRGRMTRDRKHDRTYPARGLAIITGEDRPSADTGQLGRLLLFKLHKNDVDADALADLQRAGVSGDLAAFWRGFIRAFAAQLDAYGEAKARELLQARIRADDETLPGHQRSAGALRQNRVAWLTLSTYLHRAGYITAEEAEQLNEAHLEARRIFAKEQHAIQTEERPATIFLNVIREALATGEAVLDDGTYSQSPERIVGFEHNGAIALHLEKCCRLVDQWRGQRRLGYTPAAVRQQLASDGLLADTDTKAGTTTKVVRHKGSTYRVLLLKPEAFDPPVEDVTPVTPCYTSGVTDE